MLFFYYIELYGGTEVQLNRKLENTGTNHKTQWCGCVFSICSCVFFHFTVFFLFFFYFSIQLWFVLQCHRRKHKCESRPGHLSLLLLFIEPIFHHCQTKIGMSKKLAFKHSHHGVCVLFASITQHLPYRESGNEAHLTLRTAPESQKNAGYFSRTGVMCL